MQEKYIINKTVKALISLIVLQNLVQNLCVWNPVFYAKGGLIWKSFHLGSNVQKPPFFSPMELHTEPFTKPLLNNKTKSGRHYDDSNYPWSTEGSGANKKIRPRILKSDF